MLSKSDIKIESKYELLHKKLPSDIESEEYSIRFMELKDFYYESISKVEDIQLRQKLFDSFRATQDLYHQRN